MPDTPDRDLVAQSRTTIALSRKMVELHRAERRALEEQIAAAERAIAVSKQLLGRLSVGRPLNGPPWRATEEAAGARDAKE